MLTNKPVEQEQHRPLTQVEYNNILGAIVKLQELQRSSGLITPGNPGTANAEAEAKGLIEYLSSSLINHSLELLECWKIIRSEYQPLVGAFIHIAKRVNDARAYQESQKPKTP